MRLAAYSVFYRDGQSNHIFVRAQFDKPRTVLIVLFLRDILADLDFMRKYDLVCKSGLDRVLTSLNLRRFSQLICDRYISVEHPSLRYERLTAYKLVPFLLRVHKRLQYRAEQLILPTGCHVMSLPSLIYTAFKSF